MSTEETIKVSQVEAHLGCPHCVAPLNLIIGGAQREKMLHAQEVGAEVEVVCATCRQPFNLSAAIVVMPPRDDLDGYEFSTRTKTALRNAGITTLMQVSQRNEKQLLSLKDFGKRALIEVRAALKARGLSTADDING